MVLTPSEFTNFTVQTMTDAIRLGRQFHVNLKIWLLKKFRINIVEKHFFHSLGYYIISLNVRHKHSSVPFVHCAFLLAINWNAGRPLWKILTTHLRQMQRRRHHNDRARSLIHSFNAVIYLCDIYLYLRQLGLAGDIMFSSCSFVCMSFRKCLIRSHYQHREHGILKTN